MPAQGVAAPPNGDDGTFHCPLSPPRPVHADAQGSPAEVLARLNVGRREREREDKAR